MNKTLLIIVVLIIVFIVLFATGTLWRLVCLFLSNTNPADRDISEMVVDDEGLDETCEDFVGNILIVKPAYGWGWLGNKEEPNPPAGFKMRLNSIWSREDKRRGGIGVIEEENHEYNGWTVIFSTRHYGTFNFTDKIGYYNIRITQSELIEKHGFPFPRDPNNMCSGFCEIKAAQ